MPYFKNMTIKNQNFRTKYDFLTSRNSKIGSHLSASRSETTDDIICKGKIYCKMRASKKGIKVWFNFKVNTTRKRHN